MFDKLAKSLGMPKSTMLLALLKKTQESLNDAGMLLSEAKSILPESGEGFATNSHDDISSMLKNLETTRKTLVNIAAKAEQDPRVFNGDEPTTTAPPWVSELFRDENLKH